MHLLYHMYTLADCGYLPLIVLDGEKSAFSMLCLITQYVFPFVLFLTLSGNWT